MKFQYQHIIMFIAGFLLLACATGKSDYEKLISEWLGKEIIFPEEMTDVITGDTIDLSEADFTIVTFIDSTGCTGCQMKLPLWTEFIHSLEALDASFNVIMIVSSNDVDEIRGTISNSSYEYPVYFDRSNQFEIENDIPHNIPFPSFLIDKSHRIIAMGNPVLQGGISSYYKSIISGERLLSLSRDAVIKIDDNIINLGNLNKSEIKTEKFTITNESDDTVYIRDVISSCDCTNANVSSKIIMPRSNVHGEIIFSGDSVSGECNNVVHIFYDNFKYPSIIHIFGRIL